MKTENIVLLKGNHEEEFIRFLDDYWCAEENKYRFDERVTSLMKYLHEKKDNLKSSFAPDEYYEFMQLEPDELRKIHLYLQNLPCFVSISGYILCHAGLNIPIDNISAFEVLKLQKSDDLLWSREEFYCNNNRVKNKRIIFGHTPVQAIEENRTQIWRNENNDKIGIDCGAYFSNILGCIRLDDEDVFYVRE